MKQHYILIIFLLATSIANAVGFRPLINKNGSYVPFDENTDIVAGFIPSEKYPKGSISYYRTCLGYGNSEVILHFNETCYFIALNAFNNDVIFIVPKDTTKSSLTQQDVDFYLGGYKPSVSDFVRNIKTGVEDGSIRQVFVETSLGLTAVNNTLIDETHGFTYTFQNGILSNYKRNDGFSSDAIYVKENFPKIYNQIFYNARTHYGTSNMAIAEYVNGQCKYFMRINTNYLRQAYNNIINYNFALLYCILYEGMELDEFTFLVPNAEISSSLNEYVIMSYETYSFTFKDKVLIKK